MIWVIYCLEFGDNRDTEGESPCHFVKSTIIVNRLCYT
jgi:hypothetical protein